MKPRKPNFKGLFRRQVENFATPVFIEILRGLGIQKVGDLARLVPVEQAGFEADVVHVSETLKTFNKNTK
jgi:hypothetical protein